MNKLKLQVDELGVQSFETTAEDAGRPGTVRGHRWADGGGGTDNEPTEATCTGEVVCTCETVEATCPEQWSCPCNTIAVELA